MASNHRPHIPYNQSPISSPFHIIPFSFPQNLNTLLPSLRYTVYFSHPSQLFPSSPSLSLSLLLTHAANASDDQRAEQEKKSSSRMAMEPLPLFVGDGTDAALFSSLWSFQDDLHQPQESVAELKQSLVATTLELEAGKEELKRKEQSIAKLADLVRQVAKERDDARDQLQQLLLAATATAPAPQRVTSSFTDSDCSLVSSPVDPFFDPVTSADKRCSKTTSPAATPPTPPARQQPLAGSTADAVLDMLASKRPLPQKGRLLAAVMEAGPLLQNLLVAGQLPRWRNPPTVHAPDFARAGLVGSPMANACMKRPVSMLPLTPMAAANCSPGFVAKRVRLH